MITREQLDARRQELSVQLETYRQQYVATSGAIADIDYWLSKFEELPLPSDPEILAKVSYPEGPAPIDLPPMEKDPIIS